MRTTNVILTLALLLIALTTSASAQKSMVSPVYIPGTDLEVSKSVKTLNQSIKKASAKKVINSGTKGVSSSPASFTKNTTQPAKFGPNKITNSLGSNHNMVGCDCGTGCSCDGVGGGCGCDGGCDCGVASCGCDQVGNSFFGRLRNNFPIKFSVNRGNAGGCGCSEGAGCCCDSGSCGDCSGGGSWLSRILPVSFKINSNHCSRYFSVFGGYVDLEDYDGDAPGTGLTRLIEFNDAWQIGIKRGRTFANGVRMESEISFRHATNDTYSLGNFVGPNSVSYTHLTLPTKA